VEALTLDVVEPFAPPPPVVVVESEDVGSPP
jgi:hypothetical protein